MTREEVQELLAVVSGVYQNFNPKNKTVTINAWSVLLAEQKRDEVLKAFKNYCVADTKGFPPTPGQLIQILQQSNGDNLGELEAWAAVRKALRNGTYGSKEEFEKLPKICQLAIGDASSIQEWASKNSDEIETVIMSQFLRSFRIANERCKINPDYINSQIEKKEEPIMIADESEAVPAPDYLDEIERKLKKI